MQLPQCVQKEPSKEKQVAYELAAEIERESGHRLVAVPCLGGNGIAVSDGQLIHYVEPREIASPEAFNRHLKLWLTGSVTQKSIENDQQQLTKEIDKTPQAMASEEPRAARADRRIREEATPEHGRDNAQQVGQHRNENKPSQATQDGSLVQGQRSRFPVLAKAYLLRETIKELEHEL